MANCGMGARMMMTDVTSFVIHLERAEGRKAQAAALLKQLPNAEILPAFDGAEMSAEARDAFVSCMPLLQPRYPFALNAGEIGCFASHRAAWAQIVERELRYALVVEDDVQITPAAFAQALQAAKDHVGQAGYVQFQVREVTGPTHLVARGSAQLLRPMLVPLRTSAQLVTLEGARLLLSKSEKIDRPIDAWLQMVWETGVEVTCVAPSGVSDQTAQAGGSTISRKRSFIDKLRAEVLRPWYRRKIAGLSKAHWPY